MLDPYWSLIRLVQYLWYRQCMLQGALEYGFWWVWPSDTFPSWILNIWSFSLLILQSIQYGWRFCSHKWSCWASQEAWFSVGHWRCEKRLVYFILNIWCILKDLTVTKMVSGSFDTCMWGEWWRSSRSLWMWKWCWYMHRHFE